MNVVDMGWGSSEMSLSARVVGNPTVAVTNLPEASGFHWAIKQNASFPSLWEKYLVPPDLSGTGRFPYGHPVEPDRV
jgi:hypothetical protein